MILCIECWTFLFKFFFVQKTFKTWILLDDRNLPPSFFCSIMCMMMLDLMLGIHIVSHDVGKLDLCAVCFMWIPKYSHILIKLNLEKFYLFKIFSSRVIELILFYYSIHFFSRNNITFVFLLGNRINVIEWNLFYTFTIKFLVF